jgi:hypothetical protein
VVAKTAIMLIVFLPIGTQWARFLAQNNQFNAIKNTSSFSEVLSESA